MRERLRILVALAGSHCTALTRMLRVRSIRARPAMFSPCKRVLGSRRRLLAPAARKFLPRSPRNLVSILGAIVALTTAAGVPVGYCIIGYLKEADALTYKAELTAARAAKYIYAPDGQYATEQLVAISEVRTPAAAPIRQRILDTDGALLVQKGVSLPWPTFARSAPIVASGSLVGTAEVSASLQPLLTEVLLIAFCSLLLGLAAYKAFAVLPLKVVDRSLGELEHANDKFRRLNARLELQNALLREREEKLEAQNGHLDAAMENMAQGLAMFDADERIIIANDRYAETYGLTPDQVKPGTTLEEIVEHRVAAGLFVVGNIAETVAAMRACVRKGRIENLTHVLADGRIISATIQPRPHGGWVVTHQDITKSEQLNAELARRNELLQQREAELGKQNVLFDAALENMFQGLAMFDAQERIVIANDRFAEIYKLTSDQVKPGTTLRTIAQLRIDNGLYTGLTADDVVNTMRERVAKGRVSHLTSKLGDGRIITVSIRPMPGGGWVTTHQDITEREQLNERLARQNELLQQREEELRAQNVRFNAAMSNMSQGLCLFDADQRVVLANDRYAQIYGLTPEQVKPGTTLRQILEARAANGFYDHIDKKKFVADGVAGFSDEVKQVVRLADGRYISVLRRPMSDGGLVSTHEDVTERERLNEQLDAALNNMPQGLAMFDDDQRLLICNNLYAEMYGLTREQVKPGTTVRQILEYRLANGCYAEGDPEAFLAEQTGRFAKIDSHTQKLADGRIINVSYRKAASGAHVITHQDITERHTLLAQLEENNALLGERTSRLQTIIDNFPGGISFLDRDLRIVVCNEKAKQLLDLPESLFSAGPPRIEDILRFNARRGEYGPGDEDEQVAVRLASIKERTGQFFERDRPDGTSLEVRGVPLDDGGYVTTYMDVTDRRRSEAKIAHMALHDALTGLANRVLLNEELEQALSRVKRGEIVAVHLLDLDHFKHVNDTLGHPAGDKLLKDVADRLRALVRETDTIARMGGDEFAVVQVAIGQPADATALARRIIESVSQPYELEGRHVVVGTSIGIAVGPSDGLATDQLMRNADLALYRAKGDGRGTYRFFEAGMDAEMQKRRALESDLRKALPEGQFELHYQPVVNLKTSKITGFEALLRWRHPERGMVAPGEFIELAEEIGFIVPLGEWVIREACATAAGWPPDTRVSVNLSPVQFKNPGLVAIVVGALAASGLAADRLELEITETALMDDNEATLATLYRLREIGVRIAMDDFGTGYSSLGYLQSFPFDRIKIDRSFIKDIAQGVGSLNIVRAVAALGRGLGMETTAEGVETSEQLDSVKSQGCTEMQGFLFSEPRPASELRRLFFTTDGTLSRERGEVSAA